MPRLSFGGSRTAITRISANVVVSDGHWHKVTFIRNGKVASVSVVNCNENGDTCDECLLGNATCSMSATGHTGTLNFNNNYLYVGGIPTIDPLLERPGQVSSHDFVGCLRGLSVNGRQTDMNSPIKSALVTSSCSRKLEPCSGSPCGESTTCIDNWFSNTCMCSFGMAASSCSEAQKPYSFGNDAFIELVPEERHRRGQLFTERAKGKTPKTLSFVVRTLSQNGVLMYSGSDDEYTSIQLLKGKLVYASKIKSAESIMEELEVPKINDGHWHNLSLSFQQGKFPQVNISLDRHHLGLDTKQKLHDFLDPYITSITIGGHWETPNSQNPYNDLSGCVKLITVNNQVQQQNISGYFGLYLRGSSTACQSEALGVDKMSSTDPLSIGVILVIAFFVILIVVILVSFVVFRRRKLKRDKVFQPPPPPPTKQNGVLAEGCDDRNNHQQDLVPKKMGGECPQRPDIIEREIHNKPDLASEKPFPAPEEAPEHYDLENASSIAPSDIDIVYHYKGFRDGKYKPQVPSYHKHNHRHSPHQFVLPAKNNNNNTPLARLSPSSELSQPRILTLQDISGKPLQKALLATANNPMTNSDRSTGSMQSCPPQKTLGLTSEEIDRLRPRNLSLVSTLDAVSSSSEEDQRGDEGGGGGGDPGKLAQLLESNTELMEAQDSSSDESGNDSFTCSEFEYDNYDKVTHMTPRNMIFSKLAEEDNENDEEDYAKNYDGFDSFRGSFSTLVASDDDASSNPPPYKPNNGSMLGWDCLLNWGPNFENLVGVFKDIEQLPDNATQHTDEDYV